MTEKYNVVFVRLADHQDPKQVRVMLAKALKTEETRIQTWIDARAPVTLLREVDQKTAEQVRKVALKCGAICTLEKNQPDEDAGLSLVPKKYRTTQTFICPQCEYEKEIPLGTDVEVCDSCGLVIAKWEQKITADKRKEVRRKKSLRDARLQESSKEHELRKKAELERLTGAIAELRQEMQIKGPGRFWQFFEKYTLPVSLSVATLIILVTVTSYYSYSRYRDNSDRQALLVQEPSEQIRSLAPALASGASLEASGHRQLLSEMADVANALRGQDVSRASEMGAAAILMLKGAGSGPFMQLAADAGIARVPVLPKPETATSSRAGRHVAGTDMPGVEETASVSLPPLLYRESPTDSLLDLFGKSARSAGDSGDRDALPIDAVDRLNGSKLMDLLISLRQDPLWHKFLEQQAMHLLEEDRIEDAQEIAMQIRNPAIRARVFVEIAGRLVQQERPLEMKVYKARISMELDRMGSAEQQVRFISYMTGRLAEAGDDSQLENAVDQIEERIEEHTENYTKAILESYLAIIQMNAGQLDLASTSLQRAVKTAGNIESKTKRLSAFSRIAQRYYDARDTTIANAILNEIASMAANGLRADERTRVIAEVALAQGYVGDLPGAFQSIKNTRDPGTRNQILKRLVQYLIGDTDYFKAMQVIDRESEPLTRNSLLLQLAEALIGAPNNEFARLVLQKAAVQSQLLEDSEQKSLELSKMACLFARLGDKKIARLYFKQALMPQWTGRKGEITRAAIAIDQAHALMFAESQQTLDLMEDQVIVESVETTLSSARLLSGKFSFVPAG